MTEIPIDRLAPRIVGADLDAPETEDTRRNVRRDVLEATVGKDLVIDNCNEAKAYLKYLATHDGGSPTAVNTGSWAHRTLLGVGGSAYRHRRTTGDRLPKCASAPPAPPLPRDELDATVDDLPLEPIPKE